MEQFYLKLVIKHKIYQLITLVFLLFTSCVDDVIGDISSENKPSPIFDYYFKNENIDSVFYKINLPGSIDFISDNHEDFNGSIFFRKTIDIRDLDSNYSFIVLLLYSLTTRDQSLHICCIRATKLHCLLISH